MSLSVNGSSIYKTAAEDLRGNPGQWDAYESEGNCVILAGPGSGKTKTLTIKMARMFAEDIKEPQGIACITYNSECVRELTSRLAKLGVTENNRVFIGTIHSFCLKNIVIPYAKLAGVPLPEPLKVASPIEQERIFSLVFSQQEFAHEQDEARWRTNMDAYRRTFLDRTSAEWTSKPDLAKLILDYEAVLRSQGYIDFDDMVLIGLQLVKSHDWIGKLVKARFPILVIDEYQDLGVPLHQMVLNLCFKHGVRLLAVGDPDQSIYGFTGAKPELLRDLSAIDNVKTIRLKVNYRCGKKIVMGSQGTLGLENQFEPAPGAPEGIVNFYQSTGRLQGQVDEIFDEILPSIQEHQPKIKLGDIAILYTNAYVGDQIAKKATEKNINYIRIDRNAPYPKTPLTRWLEDCAKWCANGWREGDPKLSTLINTYMSFNRSISSDSETLSIKRALVKFLWENRSPHMGLIKWLQQMYDSCLKQMFIREVTIGDEKEAFEKLIRASIDTGVMANFTVATFSGQGGSPNNLNLITLHSAKGREFEVVIIPGMDRGFFPRTDASEAVKAEQRRLFYVGVTRAKREIHLLFSEAGPSEFLVDFDKSIKDYEEK